MKCHVCGVTPADGATLFRQNEKGVPGIWACDDHAEKLPDGETLYVVDQLEKVQTQIAQALNPCAGCGCHPDERTPGCGSCRSRHWRRANKQIR